MNTLFVGKNKGLITFCKSHFHKNWEIVITTVGNGYVGGNGKSYKFDTNTIYIIPPNLPHFSYSDTEFTDFYIHVSELPFDKKNISAFYDIKKLDGLAEQLYSLYVNKHINISSNMNVINSAVEFIVKLCNNMLDEPCKNSLAKDIKDFLTENLSNTSITMDTITSKFPYSKDHLRRIFKNEYYMTPMEMLDSLRLSHAKELLEQMPMYNISQISELCGFTDPLYFSRFFKKHTHVSPKKYKSQFK